MERKRCWDVLKCGRQRGGEKAEKLGVCPASLPSEHDGVNGGEWSSRFCWAVAGTFCNEELQGAFATKLLSCINCEFFKQVNEDEGRNFILSPEE